MFTTYFLKTCGALIFQTVHFNRRNEPKLASYSLHDIFHQINAVLFTNIKDIKINYLKFLKHTLLLDIFAVFFAFNCSSNNREKRKRFSAIIF